MRSSSTRLATAVIVLGLASLLAACTTQRTSAQSPGSQAGDASGVTVFGTVDAGVGGVR
ncbi:hypothetical protein [Diaphorobacter aerolatus]|uniref:Uncharacterized protein n=1 Tax=Diaphorobacter aerolatus TaxID=1288495 RepID=A0A7H0GGV4_9BURK|nr:hypothetical protein [Diaphorobacter aerolatus]QNP47520.1 hypothetical protein H9K75_14825 [Diaphorobacter aerolatus]